MKRWDGYCALTWEYYLATKQLVHTAARVHRDMKHLGSLESTKDAQEFLSATPRATLTSFLSALQTSQVLHISMNAQLTYELIVL